MQIEKQQERAVEQNSQPSTENRVKKAYYTIAQLQKRVFGQGWPRDLNVSIERYFKYLVVEAVEMLQCVNFKEHKAPQPINKDALKEEIVDIAIYTFAVASMTFENYEEFLQCLEEKVAKNNIRKDWDINQ